MIFFPIAKSSMAMICAVVSMCPKTKCPSILSEAFKASSTLTHSPDFSEPMFVLDRVSATTSKSTICPDFRVADRQAPLMATESPSLTSVANSPMLTDNVAPEELRDIVTTLPSFCMMPVNIIFRTLFFVFGYEILCQNYVDSARNIFLQLSQCYMI